jgi:hypothetical protein
MPKINITHRVGRLQDRLAQLERGEEIAKRDIEALLDPAQIKLLNKAQAAQDALRKKHKRPKTEKEKQAIGWKTKIEVRIDFYKQAIAQEQGGMVEGIKKLQQERENKAARIFLDGYFKAEAARDKWSAGNIALQRAGFDSGYVALNKRDKEIREMEEALLKRFESELSKDEKEQLELLREHEKALQKRKR